MVGALSIKPIVSETESCSNGALESPQSIDGFMYYYVHFINVLVTLRELCDEALNFMKEMTKKIGSEMMKVQLPLLVPLPWFYNLSSNFHQKKLNMGIYSEEDKMACNNIFIQFQKDFKASMPFHPSCFAQPWDLPWTQVRTHSLNPRSFCHCGLFERMRCDSLM